MNKLELIPSIIIVTVFITVLIWGRNRIKNKAAESGRTEEFERIKKRNAAVVYPLVGLAIIGAMILKWQSIPAGNEPIAFFYLGLGVIAILFGLYKYFKLSKEK